MKKIKREEFVSILPALVEDVIVYLARLGAPSAALDRAKKCLLVTTQGGKMNRGLSVIRTAMHISVHPLDAEQNRHLNILGWIVELFQAAYLINNDIMDNSHFRRGQPCWYRREGVGLTAINDACMMLSCSRYLLKRHLSKHPEYIGIVNLLEEASLQTEVGQLTDLLVSSQSHSSFEYFTKKTYDSIAIRKTAYYSFYLPVALALHYLELTAPENLQTAENISLAIGRYFQVQDDFLDIFGDPAVTGKVGTDIEDKKCSWMIVEALSHCTYEQKENLKKSYGSNEKTAVARVKCIFEELNMRAIYERYEEETVQDINTMIAAVDESNGLKRIVFEDLLSMIYKRLN